MKGRAASLVALCLIASLAAADEIRLKDGSKITGTIVGFEDDSFKVQTSYGFAMVRKDKIAAIVPAEPKPEPKKEVAAENTKPAPTKAPAVPQVTASSATAAPTVAPPTQKKGNPAAAAAPLTPPATPGAPPASAPAQADLTKIAPATPGSSPAPEPSAPALREEVQGNLYINHSYGFRMYKPPGWHVIADAQKALPTAIVAMGTGDETTLLVIGRERVQGSLEAHAATTEQQLREIYENYRRLSERRSRVAGLPALERRYRGTVEGHDWSGVVASLVRGDEVFTILGMTYADSDLIQIQENVIARTIASLEFTH